MPRIITADKNISDGVAYTFLQRINTDLPMLLVSRVDNLDFNEEILTLEGKEYILVDYVELGWDWNRSFGHHWGLNTYKFNEVFKGEGWERIESFITNNPPKITLCRELLMQDVSDKLQPISYPCFLHPEPIQSFDEFNSRPFEVIFGWGLSHEYRKKLHAKIWNKAGKYGYSVCDNIYYIGGFLQYEQTPRKWLTMNIPHYARIPMNEYIKINGMAKISISLAGAGRSCFRHCESPINSVMLMWEDNLAWHKDMWVHGENCLKCEEGNEIETINAWLQKPEELYQIYLNGIKTVDFFRLDNYAKYIESIINK